MHKGLGLFLKDNSLDLAYLDRKSGKFHFITAFRSNILPSSPQKRREVLLTSLKKAFETVKPQTRNLSVCLTSSLTRLKRIEAHGIKSRGKRRVIKREGIEAASLKPNDITAVRTSPAKSLRGSGLETIFAAADRETAENCLWALQTLRISPAAIEPVLLSVLRILRLSGQLPSDKPALILYFETDSLINAAVAGDKEIIFSRTIYLGAAGGKPVDDFMAQVGFLSDYFKSPPHRIQISKIIVCGDTNPDKWITPLKQRFELPVELGKPSLVVTDLPDTPGWSAALGAALQAVRREPLLVNLMPVSAVTPKKILIAVTAAASILLIAAVLIFGLLQTEVLKSRLLKYVRPAAEEPARGLLDGGLSSKIGTALTLTGLRLEGISLSREYQYAIINGRIYKAGDTVKGYEIEAVHEGSVTLKKDGKDFRIFLYKNQEKEGQGEE